MRRLTSFIDSLNLINYEMIVKLTIANAMTV